MSHWRGYGPVSNPQENSPPPNSHDSLTPIPLFTYSSDTSKQNNQPTVGVHETTHLAPKRTPTSDLALWQLSFDLIIAIPAICFIVYAILVKCNEGKSFDTDPVPALVAASQYGPTVFPIVFAAVATNLLKAAAAWKLERGISVLSLEFLLKSRTVFSALTSPLLLRAANIVTPFIVLLWVLSPVGGQAALRVVMRRPSTEIHPWSGQYVEFNGEMTHLGPTTSAGKGVLPEILGVFYAALSTPLSAKVASQDVFGHMKVPMIEPFIEANMTHDQDGWYSIENDTNVDYSSLSGLPLISNDTLLVPYNRSFVVDTAYMTANCKLKMQELAASDSDDPKNGGKLRWSEWLRYIANLPPMPITYSNGRTLIISGDYFRPQTETTPRLLNFTSATGSYLTNATCELRTSFVEVDMKCHNTKCGPVRIRTSSRIPQNMTVFTVMDGLSPFGKLTMNNMQGSALLKTLINSTNTPWVSDMPTGVYSSPLEYYMVNPGSPFSPPFNNWYFGEDVGLVDEGIVSRRFTQLLNTFWIANVAPGAALGDFTCAKYQFPLPPGTNATNPYCRDTTGTMTPDILVLRADNAWFAILLLASFTMLVSALAAAVLGILRQGPDILDYAITMVRYSAYTDLAGGNSMEDGHDQTKRLRNHRLCLGDINGGETHGLVSLGAADEAIPLNKQVDARNYK